MDRLLARFAQEVDTAVEIVTIYEKAGIQKELVDEEYFLSLQSTHPSSAWFERKIHDDFGLKIAKGYDNRPFWQHETMPPPHSNEKIFSSDPN